ncbi:HUA enhancer 2 [Coccomyxa subellipsoidea C-169]|uniref:HUA enhancer 2 n=1 Tax=Coccomyxa subellipsoidea (strain C-169) TaxID=574566 RepID=I0YNB1_COCSC|nr:HUA enhancer 2 [Coccomyxa subellipsoidea C-169]EIE19880.1 HUA enhancer 2 [Coccomyxa subellipsoidea C-169]|eukprot:XP_005644424.1 HUA enhancer 2 [Coccomyxa subellipsoidea C-169]
MEETPEGMAVAAATREAAKRKREAENGLPEAKRPARPIPLISHEVAVPKGYDEAAKNLDPALHGTLENPRWSGPRAKEYPFVLDPFQEVSVACIERRESVLVSAHTSAGKTAVAEYAIALAFKNNQRVVYTSPLKALSNQKFRELSEEFEDVGLMTGDVSINPNARCIVMTTEILRSMLYRGSEVLREVAWVVFDEVHYMQDRERGVVWEETIIFLPPETKMVFLSATLSNAAEFAAWVAALHKQPCHVVYTDFRPTPLQHYAYAPGAKGLFLVLDEKGNFKDENFSKLRSEVAPETAADDAPSTSGRGAENGGRGGRGRGRGRNSGGRSGGGRGDKGKGDTAAHIYKIVKMIKDRNFEPVIVFSFSRRECEMYARTLMKPDAKGNAINFNSPEEQEMVGDVFAQAIQSLSEADREMPPVVEILKLLRAGIAVHHSGLLPILKEVVELLFQEGLIKALFATETFAMGLNMPARTVVFTAMEKWDGETNRFMSSGEYIQMSGRAGRRGKDDRGMCIMMIDDKMDAASCRGIVQGKPSPLLSRFRLTYYTLLNILRRAEGSGQSMEYVIARSFQQFQFERSLPQVQKELREVEERAAQIGAATQEAMDEYQTLKAEIEGAERVLTPALLRPERCMHFLRPGRLVRVREGPYDWGWGIVVAVHQKGRPKPKVSLLKGTSKLCAIPGQRKERATPMPEPAGRGRPGEMNVLPVPLQLLTAISTLRISIPPDLRPIEARKATLATVRGLEQQYPNGIPELDPAEDFQVEEPEALAAAAKLGSLQARLRRNPVYQAERDEKKMLDVERQAVLAAQAVALRRKLTESHLAKFRTEAKNRTAVLRKLGHVTAEGVVSLKGRAACEISTGDELLTTELMLNGVFNSLDVHQLVAVISCLVPVEKSNEEVKLKAELAEPLAALQDTARAIAEVQRECKLEVDPDEYVESFKPFLMDVIYAWSKGEQFVDVCGRTDIFEGSIIRATRRLDELVNELAAAASVIGDVGLEEKFRAAAATIRRDIMFAASLYI